ncbi:uncharacterized protein LOC111076250 [Drosophila obscura]|uniref:uncharacterized protein LOC111076250 n=1 Tax=Drosophila obscura TaxID=7282 RepID=UPI001BB1D646|nr:uncharacterized protein LOC111076250 [Drosophila obscura]
MADVPQNLTPHQLLVDELFPEKMNLNRYQRDLADQVILAICQGHYHEAKRILKTQRQGSRSLPPWDTLILGGIVLRLQLRRKLLLGEDMNMIDELDDNQIAIMAKLIQNPELALAYNRVLEKFYEKIERTLGEVNPNINKQLRHWERILQRQIVEEAYYRRFLVPIAVTIISLVVCLVGIWL